MFRQATSQMRRFATPLFRRGGCRPRTTGAQQTLRSGQLPKPFWNSGKVLLFSTATGTTTYYYGVNDETPRYQLPGRKASGPQYASKRELEKVINVAFLGSPSMLINRVGCSRAKASTWRRCYQHRRRRSASTWVFRMVIHQHRPTPSRSRLP